MINNSKFQQVCQKIIVEHQLFNEDENVVSEGLFQKITNVLNRRLWDSSTEAFPYKAVNRFLKNNGFFRIGDKEYVSVLFKDEHINDVNTFYNEFGNIGEILNNENEEEYEGLDKEGLKQSYKELLGSIVGYYLILTLPHSMSGSKTLNEDIFGSNIKFKLMSGKSRKSKKWSFDINYKSTESDIVDLIEEKLQEYGLHLNDRYPYPSEINDHPMLLFFGFGPDNVDNIINQFKKFGLHLTKIVNEEGVVIGIDYKAKSSKSSSSKNISRPKSSGRTRKDIFSISEVYALIHKYKFKRNNNIFTKKQGKYTIRFEINKDDLGNDRMDHNWISFEVSTQDDAYEFGDDKLWEVNDRVEDLVEYIETNIQNHFNDSNFQLSEK